MMTLLTDCRAGGGQQTRFFRGQIGTLGSNAVAANAALLRPAALIKPPQAIILNMLPFVVFVQSAVEIHNGKSMSL